MTLLRKLLQQDSYTTGKHGKHAKQWKYNFREENHMESEKTPGILKLNKKNVKIIEAMAL